MLTFISKKHLLFLAIIVVGAGLMYLTEGRWEHIGLGMINGAVAVDIYQRYQNHRQSLLKQSNQES